MLTMTAITLFEVDGDPERIKDAAPSVKRDPPTRLEESADEEEFEPTFESGKRLQYSGEGRYGSSFGEGVGDLWEIDQVQAQHRHQQGEKFGGG